MDEVKKRLKERYLQLKREHGWSEDEMALSMKSGNNQNKNIKKKSKGKYFKGRCNHCGKFGHKKAEFESKNSEDDKSKVGPGTPRNTEEPHGTPPMQSYVSTTQVMIEWETSTIEDNSATPEVPELSSMMDGIVKVRRIREKSKYDQRTAGS